MKKLTINRFPPLDYSCNEALNTLCTNISFAGNGIRKIMLTSCQPKEGKSFLAMNLMRQLAGIGQGVVLVDADLRRSTLVGRHAIHSPDTMLGLSHYLAGMCSVDDIIYQTNISNAYMVPSGHDVVNSLSLLNTARLSNLLNELAKSFDYVIVDAPPVGIIIDAAQIAKSCDGILLVVSNNNVDRRELAEATRQLEKTGCPILGAVLNKVAFDTHSSKKYYYRTYYTHYSSGHYKAPPRRRKTPDEPVIPSAAKKGPKG